MQRLIETYMWSMIMHAWIRWIITVAPTPPPAAAGMQS